MVSVRSQDKPSMSCFLGDFSVKETIINRLRVKMAFIYKKVFMYENRSKYACLELIFQGKFSRKESYHVRAPSILRNHIINM